MTQEHQQALFVEDPRTGKAGRGEATELLTLGNDQHLHHHPKSLGQPGSRTSSGSGCFAQVYFALYIPHQEVVKISNESRVTEFILKGFPLSRQMEIFLFVLFLMFYLVTLSGNLVIITITLADYRLRTPMYFFLWNFSFMEILFTSVTVPKHLSGLLFGSRIISFTSCMVQSFFYFFLAVTEFLLLAVMSFDRYVAICNPLRYTVIMNSHVCSVLVFGAWTGAFLYVLGPLSAVAEVTYCGPNVVNHFFCDITPLVKLSCKDTHVLESAIFILASVLILSSLVVTAVSYLYIITTVLRTPMAQGRRKAFSTCTSHITVVSIVYSTHIYMHVRPIESSSLELNKVVALLTSVVTPSLNPFIYTLRNEQVKQALKEAVAQNKVFLFYKKFTP
ncbi:olfactory receptor 6M1-like [Mauremys reevesii]|uniref:olfactory receptor 6M1-like n=1 Tax=Mauremys reevesii TaxID=260615 RepID=UPI001940045A|nr:olfactory receptor 6M1-like [Mauremys reevesii]